MLIWSLFWAIQFLLLWALSGAFISLFWFVRILISKYRGNSQRAFWLMLFVITLISIYTYDWYISLLPIISTYISTYALFYLKDVNFRIALILPTIMWLIYNYNVWSLWWTLREIIILLLHFKVIALSIGFAYKKEIYTLNYDVFVYIYNNSTSKAYRLWKTFLYYWKLALKPFFQRKKWALWKILSH